MNGQLELISFEKIRHIKLFVNNIVYRAFHTHNAGELLCVLEGEAIVSVQNEKFTVRRGDVLMISPHKVHDILSLEKNGTKFLILQISRHFMQDYLPNFRTTVFTDIFPTEKLDEKTGRKLWRCLFELAAKYFQNDEKDDALFILSRTFGVLEILFSALRYEILNEEQYLDHKKIAARITRIVEYVDKNYQYRVRLEDVAREENLSPNYVSQFFPKYIGVTFQNYLNKVRLEAALRLLPNETLSVSETANYAGFADAKYMSEIFRRYFGVTPREYRKTQRALLPVAEKKEASTEYIYDRRTSYSIVTKAAAHAEEFFVRKTEKTSSSDSRDV